MSFPWEFCWGGLYSQYDKKKNIKENAFPTKAMPNMYLQVHIFLNRSSLNLVIYLLKYQLSYTRHAPLSSQELCHKTQVLSINIPKINGDGMVPRNLTFSSWIPRAKERWSSLTHLKVKWTISIRWATFDYLRVAVKAGIVLRNVKNRVPKDSATKIHILLQLPPHIVLTAS